MKIGVFGTGYVGLVTGVCFAEMGNDVICADINEEKIQQLRKGISPIYEPGLDELITQNLKEERLHFTTDLKQCVRESDILFIAVGTPSSEDGQADLSAVRSVAQSIGQLLEKPSFVVNKSTVPVGTARATREIIESELRKRGLSFSVDVISNPEFLREGNAIEDCLKPNRVVVGCRSPEAEKVMRRLYEPFLKSGNALLVMDPESSEMTKYAANAMLATRISLMNEFSRVCEKLGADVEQVRKGIGSDPRIGPQFIFAGIGYGGSCFPKDVKALIHMGKQCDENLQILHAVEETNRIQRKRFIQKIREKFPQGLRGEKLALWGVAFKPGTDDIREAPALDLIQFLLDSGATLKAYDPAAAENASAYFNSPHLNFVQTPYACLEGASALVIATEWKAFRDPDFQRMKSLMKIPQIFDGRNIYNVSLLRDQGFFYESIGRSSNLRTGSL